MKYLLTTFLVFLLISCSSVDIKDHWKNPDIDIYDAQKVLVVGMTPNINARQQFETKLKEEYEARGIEAVKSLDVFEPDFTTEQKSETELKRIENILVANGFDTVLFTKVVGVEDKIIHRKTYSYEENTKHRFKDDYLMYQDVFFNPDYYEEYTVYKVETALYCICPGKDRELIWKGFIDITDPRSTKETVNDFVKLVILVLEDQRLLTTVKTTEEENYKI